MQGGMYCSYQNGKGRFGNCLCHPMSRELVPKILWIAYQGLIEQLSAFGGNNSGQDNKPYSSDGTEYALAQTGLCVWPGPQLGS